MKIAVINGPNINMLGVREPNIYGVNSYEDLKKYIEDYAIECGIETVVLQSNSEGEIIDYIQRAAADFDAVVINPGAYTHYSYAIYDALLAAQLPTVEVHISNIHKRDEFRHKSITAPACCGQICGLGFRGYILAMEYLIGEVSKEEQDD